MISIHYEDIIEGTVWFFFEGTADSMLALKKKV